MSAEAMFNANVERIVREGFAEFIGEPRAEWDREHRIPSDASEKE